MIRTGLVAAIVAVAGTAAADTTVWDRAFADNQVDAAMDTYRRHLETGNEEVQLATSEPPGRSKNRHVKEAITAYRNAITAMPDQPEAHYRLGIAEYTYFLVCDAGPTTLCDRDNPDPAVMKDVADHWHRFAELAPLDTRGTGLLFPCALLHTKITTHDHLLLAIADYEEFIDRHQGDPMGDANTALSNLAETYMMVDRLDDAIGAFERAGDHGGDISTLYGLAVALDRDGQGTRARQIISELKLSAFEAFQGKVIAGESFFVPEGEVNYYLALAEESLGMPQQAIVHWDLFIRSKAHPQFQPRAKHNRDALKARLRRGMK